ncbi:diguanylate cyclase [Alkalimonas sp. MEB108]|uniref:diguanylate cyclase n=1 Tax=Alkalimonas cellulosilytica TaxID=3058395 RepID=A0ABU7J1E9_9GAMM|nr:diguanylate cyclase [Alkalimonas sp. MEB108]MEE1999857.1 diguanylate cyclase [Alkalimonas sp. MEB108]
MVLKWCWICLLFSFSLQAIERSLHDYDIKHWNSADGLASNSVRALTQDQQGYIWAGTLYGLSRFDGFRFDTFTSQQHRQLASNSINQLMTDSQGLIWIGTKAGLSRLDPKTLIFERFNILTEVTAMAEVRPGEVWVAAEHLFRVQAGRVSRFSPVRQPVMQLRSTEHDVWLTTSEHLIRYELDSGQLQHYLLPRELQQSRIYDIALTDGQVHLATEVGFYHLNSEGEVARCDLLAQESSAIYRIFRDSHGSDWISGYSRLHQRHQGQDWQQISATELGSSPWFYDIFEDKDSNIWLASFSDGIFRASPGHVRRVVGEMQTDPIVRSLLVTPEQRLLIATQSSLGYLSEHGQFQLLLDQQVLGSQSIHDIHFSDDSWWLAMDNGLFRYEPGSQTISSLASELEGSTVRFIQPRQAGGSWIGGAAGLFYWQDQQLRPFAFNRELESRHVTTIQDQSWYQVVGTTRGLYQLQQQRLQRLGIGSPLYNSYIMSLLILPDETLLVGTLDDGLFVRFPNAEWRQFDNSNGLPYGPVVAMLFDEQQQQLWFSTLKGVFRLPLPALSQLKQDPLQAEQILTPYQRQLGNTPGRCCNGAGHAKLALWQDQLWFPSLQGVVAIDRFFKRSNDPDFRPLLQQIQGQRSFLLRDHQARQVLPVNERSFSIHYTALDFFNATSLQFRYRLHGFDKVWQQAASRREAIYTNLPPGHYQFEVQVRQQNQSWAEAQSSRIDLVVPRRFDETWMYQVLWFALLGLILSGLFWLVRRNNQQQQLALSRLVRQRTQELENSNNRLNELNAQLGQLVHKDTLTGLRNRRFLFEQLPKDIEHYQRNRQSLQQQGKCVALIHLDLDGFKSINDQYGQSAGDSLLQQISALLLRETRGSDYVVRYAGEEFLLVLRDIDTSILWDFTNKLHALVGTTRFPLPDGQRIQLTCSIGYSIYPLQLIGGQLMNWELSLQLAEMALYRVKHEGKDGVATLIFDARVDAFEFEESMHIEAQIEQLLFEGLVQFKIKAANHQGPASETGEP